MARAHKLVVRSRPREATTTRTLCTSSKANWRLRLRHLETPTDTMARPLPGKGALVLLLAAVTSTAFTPSRSSRRPAASSPHIGGRLAASAVALLSSVRRSRPPPAQDLPRLPLRRPPPTGPPDAATARARRHCLSRLRTGWPAEASAGAVPLDDRGEGAGRDREDAGRGALRAGGAGHRGPCRAAGGDDRRDRSNRTRGGGVAGRVSISLELPLFSEKLLHA